MMYEFLRNILRAGFVAGLVSGVSVVSAQGVTSAGPLYKLTASGWTMGYLAGAPVLAERAYAAGAVSHEAAIMDMFKLGTRAGEAAITATRTVTAAEVALTSAKWLGTAALRGGPYLAAAGLLYDVWRGVRARPDGLGGVEVDPGVLPPTSGTADFYTVPGCTPERASQSAASAGCNGVASGLPGGYANCSGAQEGGDWVTRCNLSPTDARRVIYTNIIQVVPKPMVGACPQVELATGAVLPLPSEDGRCATGRYTAVSQAEAAALVKDGARFRDQMLRDHVDLLVKENQEIKPKSVTPDMSGPATLESPPKTVTTTKPGGAKEEVTTKEKVGLTYGPGTVSKTEGQTKSTRTIAPDGTVTPGDTVDADTTPTPAENPPDLCEKNPEISACKKLDQPADDQPLPREDWTLNFTPHFFASSPTCPAPITVTAPRVSFVMVWNPLCDLSRDFLHPIVLVMSAVSAMRVFVGGFKV